MAYATIGIDVGKILPLSANCSCRVLKRLADWLHLESGTKVNLVFSCIKTHVSLLKNNGS